MSQKLKLQYYEMKKNALPSTLESKRNKIIKNSKGLITGVVRGKSIFCQLKKVFGLKKNKASNSFSLAFQSKINPFNNLHLL